MKTTQAADGKAWKRPERRPSDKPRLYNDKPALTRQGIAKNAAKLVKEGTYVNLGVGIPTMVSNYFEGRDVILHAENGVLGYGRMLTEENEIDPDIYNAAGQFVALTPGASFFDSVTSFEMARGGTIDTVILGAYEVDETGSVANWSTPDAKRGGIGGAMDLLSGKGDLIIVMEHTDSKGRPKLRKQCTYPLTGKGCVSYVVTDLAVLRWDKDRFVVDAVAPGFTPQEVIALTEMDIGAAANVQDHGGDQEAVHQRRDELGPLRHGSRLSRTLNPSDQETTVARLPIATRESVPATQRTLFDELIQRLGAVPRRWSGLGDDPCARGPALGHRAE